MCGVMVFGVMALAAVWDTPYFTPMFLMFVAVCFAAKN